MTESQRAMVVNETDLPDEAVLHAIETHFVEHALSFGDSTTFQTYTNNGGSLLARKNFRTPSNVFEEIKLARDLAERDDDVGASMGAMIALAFGEGMQNTHRDEVTVALFNEVAKHTNLDGLFKDLYREYLIASSVTTVSLFTRESFSFLPEGTERYRTRSVVAPLVGVLPAEQVRVVGNDIFGTGQLAYLPELDAIKRWLDEFFEPGTSPARKAEMRRDDPVAATMFTRRVQLPLDDAYHPGEFVYEMNPRMVHRSTMPKGAWTYPRPLLTRNFALLEAKRLLNIMDYALLQGGANFLVVAKKGTDERPALPEEVTNLRDVIRRSSRTGVIVGDHRLAIEIITPSLKELLNPEKRRLLGRKLSMALMRVPEHGTDDPGSEGMKSEVEIMTRVISSDRADLRRHVGNHVYGETAKRNPTTFAGGPASIWFPKIILQGTQYFTDYILKMRDRGDIPRRFAVEAAGFSYDAAVQQRQRELAAGHDEILMPAAVPFSNPGEPQDNSDGRPRGSSPNNGAPGATRREQPASPRKRTLQRNAGETVKAIYDEELNKVIRVGETTHGLLEEYAATVQEGRITALERRALDAGEVTQEGPVVVVPVNPDYEVSALRAMRLGDGVSILVGLRNGDKALIAKALCFREPQYELADAEARAIRWGFQVNGVEVKDDEA